MAKVLATSVTVEDIRTIDGTSAIKPETPFVPGNEAVMEIIETGSDVTGLKIGDRVIPKLNFMGTWRSAIVAKEEDFIKVCYLLSLIFFLFNGTKVCKMIRMHNNQRSNFEIRYCHLTTKLFKESLVSILYWLCINY